MKPSEARRTVQRAHARPSSNAPSRLAEIHERRLWDSVETITDGFAVFDPQDRLIAANSAWLSLFDYSEVIKLRP